MKTYIMIGASLGAFLLASCQESKPEPKIDFSSVKDIDGKKVDEKTAKSVYAKSQNTQPQNRLAREIYLRARMKQRKNLPLSEAEKKSLEKDLTVSQEDKDNMNKSHRIIYKPSN